MKSDNNKDNSSSNSNKIINNTLPTLRRSVNARCQQARKYAEVKNPGRRGVSGTPAQQKLLFVECADLLAFLPKTRFRVDTVVDGFFSTLGKKPISVFDRMEEIGRAVGKVMFTRLPVQSKALQRFHQARLFQHANASQGNNAHCGRRGTSVQRLPSDLLLES